MEIKTICKRMDLRRDFDEEVNKALADGWQLEVRGVLPGARLSDNIHDERMLYAELVKPGKAKEPEAPDLMAAARLVQDTCLQFKGCRSCPLGDICEHEPPYKWDLAEEVKA